MARSVGSRPRAHTRRHSSVTGNAQSHTRAHARIHTHSHTHTCMPMHSHAHTRSHTRMHTRTRTHMHAHTHAHAHAHVCTWPCLQKLPYRKGIGPGCYDVDPLNEKGSASLSILPGEVHKVHGYAKDPTRQSSCFASPERYVSVLYWVHIMWTWDTMPLA